jgi:hypothetical protein
LKCDRCGAENPEGSKFCGLCYGEFPADVSTPDAPFDPIWHEAPADGVPPVGVGGAAGLHPGVDFSEVGGGGQSGYGGGGMGIGAVPVAPPPFNPGGPGGGGPGTVGPLTPISTDPPGPPPVEVLASPDYWQSTLRAGSGGGWGNMGGGFKLVLLAVFVVVFGLIAFSIVNIVNVANPHSALDATDLRSALGHLYATDSWEASVFVDKGGKRTEKANIYFEENMGTVLEILDENKTPVKVTYVEDSGIKSVSYALNGQAGAWVIDLNLHDERISISPYEVSSKTDGRNGSEQKLYEFEVPADDLPFVKQFADPGTGNIKARVWAEDLGDELTDYKEVSEIELTLVSGAKVDIVFQNYGKDTLTQWKVPARTDDQLTDSQPGSNLMYIGSVLPRRGTNDQSVSVQIVGGGFQQGWSACLSDGTTEIAGTGVSVLGTTQILCTFDLKGKKPGNWALLLVDPSGKKCNASYFVIDSPTGQ